MRRTAIITIASTDEKNRDRGKAYLLNEMSALQASRWATRAMMAILKAGHDIPDEVSKAGMAGILSLGLKAFAGVEFDTVELLMKELDGCVSYIPVPSTPNIVRPLMADDDIDEVSTIMKLRLEAFALHTGFSWAELMLKLTSATKKTETVS